MKSILNFIITGLIVFALSYFLPGVEVSSIWSAIGVGLVLGLLNFFVKPLLVLFTLPATLITFGLFLWVINAVIILMVSWLMESSFHVQSFWWALLFSFLLSICQSLFQIKNSESEN